LPPYDLATSVAGLRIETREVEGQIAALAEELGLA